MKNEALYKKVRGRNGVYSITVSYSPFTGVFMISSQKNMVPVKNYDVILSAFNKIEQYISKETVERAVVVLLSKLETPKSTPIKWLKSAMIGVTRKYLQERRDMYLSANEPYEYFGGMTTSYMIYNYEPTEGLEEEFQHYIIGVQGNMWSEYVWGKNYLQYKIFPRSLAVAEIGWTNSEYKDWTRFLMNYACHHKDALNQLGVVDAGMQYGTIGEWKKGELSVGKWVSIEFPVDDCLNKKGTIQAAFVYKGGSDTHVRNVKFLFDGAQVGEDDHESIVTEFEMNTVYTFNTDKVPGRKISLQAEMMCSDNPDCQGIIYVYCVKAVNDNEKKVPKRNYDF